ncbi:hypothetical protein CAPN004_12290 [Capnocytophaga cynodegmi]|uniref:hypothetical protein n=1 Tax=Capnocytophaga cynodegmi TaxID=28189 RepID=UPI001ACA61E0|nr:hypothetical protein [Capnocytophaga cynodegmi]GIM52199.1 hypothetical protein CAPN004_12290 [Capnocytophaga cynodegmi]
MQKVQNVNRILFLFFLLGISNSIFSQKTLEGRFVNNTNWYQFHTDGTFDYADVGELGIKKEGRGHYTLTKDSLILNYDLTDIPFSGYHLTKSYVNSKDSIDINVSVYDFDRNPLPNSQVFLTEGAGKKHMLTDKNGKVKLTIKKEKIEDFLTIIYNYECMHHIPEIFFQNNYDITIFLTKKPFTEPFDRGKAIKDEIKKYKILKNKKDYLELQQPNGTILKLKKVEKGFYSDDPFE